MTSCQLIAEKLNVCARWGHCGGLGLIEYTRSWLSASRVKIEKGFLRHGRSISISPSNPPSSQLPAFGFRLRPSSFWSPKASAFDKKLHEGPIAGEAG